MHAATKVTGSSGRRLACHIVHCRQAATPARADLDDAATQAQVKRTVHSVYGAGRWRSAAPAPEAVPETETMGKGTASPGARGTVGACVHIPLLSIQRNEYGTRT